MTDFTSVSIRIPKDWQAFERHSRLLFEHALGDPATQNNGRPGQRQHGIDIYGRRGGGSGPLVGVQCKGKDSDYGSIVSEHELRREVTKTEKFEPALSEFILITTAPNDAVIQEAARRLEQEVRAAGRDLSISVWGWERVQQEINRYGEVIKAFHPDATPFTDLQLEAAAQTRQDSAQIKEMLASEAAERRASEERILKLFESRLSPAQIVNTDAPTRSSPVDKVLNDQIDNLRDLIRNDRPRTALGLLAALKEKSWTTASNKIRFRILGNIGAAHYALTEFDRAADYFIEAAPYDPDTPISHANKIAGLLIKGRQPEALTLVKDAFGKFSDSIDLALQRLQAREQNEEIDQLWAQLPAPMRERPELLLFRIVALRADNDPRWRSLAEGAVPAAPVEEKLKIIRAEAILDRLLSHDRSALGSDSWEAPDQAEIESAAATLDAIWQRSKEREAPPYIGTPHNAALAYAILGRPEDARRLLDEALKNPEAGDEIKRLRLSLYPRHGRLDEAIMLAETLGDAPQNRIMHAELLIHSAPSEARAILSQRWSFTNKSDILAASFIVVDCYIAQQNFDDALAEANQLRERFPDDVHPFLTIYRIKKASAAPEAAAALDEALSRLDERADFVSRFMVADELAKAQRWDDVIRIVHPYVSRRFDSPSLRALIAAAANGDRREILKSVLAELPEEVATRPYYRRARIAFAIRVQDIKGAEEEIRCYLRENPRALEMHLQLMHALFRQEKREELRSEAAKPASDFDGNPLDFVKLAQFKDGFGDWREAYALAYRTLLANFESDEVTMAYVAVFLHSGHSTGLDVEPNAVSDNMAVALTIESELPRVFVIESDPTLRPSPQYVAPNHPIAEALRGHGKGDKVRLPDGTDSTIAWIKPKVLHALHEILENFQRLFPHSDGLERVTIDTSQAGGLGEIIERLQQRQQAIEQLFGTYETGLVPIACIARSLGKETVDTFAAIAQSGRNIRVCEGTQQEREAAVTSIRANGRKGCVLDPIAMHIVRRLNLERAVVAVCGSIGTVENSVLRLTQRIYELEQNLDEPDMSLSWSNGQTYRHIFPPEEKRKALDEIRADRDWMRSLDILPAQGNTDLPPELNELTARFGSGFLDEARAAQGSTRIFVCEDQALRVLTSAAFKIPATWLQPVLMLAKDGGHISAEDYRQTIVYLIQARLDFISVDAQLLNLTLQGTTSHDLPEDFLTVADRLGGAKADLSSHLRGAAVAIAHFWRNDGMSSIVREAAVGRLLENLCRERNPEQVHLIIRAFLGFNRKVIRDVRFDHYVADWIRGHFVPME
jgi:tetratricopeptide (TPR) repeat protein